MRRAPCGRVQAIDGPAEFQDPIVCGFLLSLRVGFLGLFPVRLSRHFILELFDLATETRQFPLDALVLAVTQVPDLLDPVGARPALTATRLAAVGAALRGDTVGEVGIAGVHGGPEEVSTSGVGIDRLPVDVRVGRGNTIV